MKPLRPLGSALLATPLFTAHVVAASLFLMPLPAYAQTAGTPESLLDALSLISSSMLVAPMAAPAVTQDGDRFHVRIPLPKLTSPPDAAIEIAASPLSSGVWDITSLMFPATGSVPVAATPGHPAMSLTFAIGRQSSHAQVDPTLTVPSPYVLDLGDIVVRGEGPSPGGLTVAKVKIDGTMTGDAAHHLNSQSHGTVDNVLLTLPSQTGPSSTGPNPTGAPFTLALYSMDMQSHLDGVDRAQAVRWQTAMRAINESRPPPPQMVPGQPPAPPPPPTPEQRAQVHALIDASKGLMSAMNVEETFHGMNFGAVGGPKGEIGAIRFAVAGEARDDRIGGHFDIALTDIKSEGVPPQYAPYMPRRFAIKATVAGVPAEKLRASLHQAADAPAGLVSMQTVLLAMLNEPGATAGFQSLVIEAGPLLIEGSGHVLPSATGSAGFELHLTAHGVDAMMALIQADPKASQMMPMLFLAKGMAKPEGDGLVWNISFGNGGITINGVPMGQRPRGPEMRGDPMPMRPGTAGRPPITR